MITTPRPDTAPPMDAIDRWWERHIIAQLDRLAVAYPDLYAAAAARVAQQSTPATDPVTPQPGEKTI